MLPSQMSGLRRLLALTGFALLAVVLSWPLPVHLATHLPGAPGGDTGTYVWNLWVFRYELLHHGHWPFATEQIFAATGGTDLAAHNYTVFADLVALPLIGPLGVVAAFNLVYLVLIASSGYATYLLMRRLTGRDLEAWIAGAAFAASPALIARGTAHFSLVAAAPLPIFLLFADSALSSGQRRAAALAGAAMGWAGYCDAYFPIYCALMGAFLTGHELWALERHEAPPSSAWWLRVVDGLLLAGAVVVCWRLWHGEAAVAVFGWTISVRTLYTPMLLLTVLGVVRLQLGLRLRLRRRAGSLDVRRAAGLVAVAIGVAVFVLSPVIVGLAGRLAEGRFPAPAINWRSSPAGLDVINLIVPNPEHPWFGGPGMRWILRRSAMAYPEEVGSLSLVALGVVALALWRDRRAVPARWIAFTAVFAALALGPFVQIAGVNTTIPGPWWILRFVPIVELARMPGRFVIVAALGLSILLGFALVSLRQRWPTRWRVVLSALCGLLAFELMPVPRTLFDAAIPSVYGIVRQDPDPSVRVLDLPGGIRDGTSSIGDFSSASEYFQTAHEKPLVGGYVSRVSDRERQESLAIPMLAALYRLSENQPLPPDLAAEAWATRKQFLRRACLGYVVIDQRASDALRRFAIDALELVPLADSGGRTLFAPAARPPAPCAADEPRRRAFPF